MRGNGRHRLLALLVVAACVVLFLWRGGRPAAALAIEREVARGPGHVFALEEITHFDWDRVFFFPPYTRREDVEAALGEPASGWLDSRIEESDAIVLVVFVHGGRVVESFDLPRAPADLAPCAADGRRGIARSKARFTVGPDGAVRPMQEPVPE